MAGLTEISPEQITSNYDGPIPDSFEGMSLKENMVQAINLNLNAESPSPIQQNVIPPIVAGKNVALLAPPTSGKTFAFAIAAFQKYEPGCPKIIIVQPTRESAVEFQSILRAIEPIRCGLSISARMDLDSQEVKDADVVVTTPRSINDLLTNKETIFDNGELDDIGLCVVDGVETMSERGDAGHLLEVIQKLPSGTQLVLGSGGMESEVKSLMSKQQGETVNITVDA